MHEGHRERMRDKLFAHGEKLTDCEILEILLIGYLYAIDGCAIRYVSLFKASYAYPPALCRGATPICLKELIFYVQCGYCWCPVG